MPETPHYAQPKNTLGISLNQWDILILCVFFGLIAAIAWGAQQMTGAYQLGQALPMTLDVAALPGYALRSVLRMAIALFFSLLFTFTFGTLAAKSVRAERIILPFIDIMQSVPILAFLSIAMLAFIVLFPGSLLGPESAAIFAIFSCQAWNMALSFYQSLKTIPKELREAAAIFHVGPWQRFWRIEVPYAMPGLLWNTMLSLSAGWFFVVASEAFIIANQPVALPGIGAYIALATQQMNSMAIVYAIIAMFLVIVLYDQLLFRPLMVWAEKFKVQPDEAIETQGAWFLDLLQRTHIRRYGFHIFDRLQDWLVNPRLLKKNRAPLSKATKKIIFATCNLLWQTVVTIAIISSIGFLIHFIYTSIALSEITHVLYLGLVTAFKITILVLLSSLIWVPIGVWIGFNPRIASIIQPLLQIMAAFPANILYPIMFMLIIKYQLNVNIWSSPLMILGTQWYILFNVIAGTGSISKELRMVGENYGLKGWLWWKRLMLPGIFPFYITGAMTAAGGCWNASIIADVISWGDQKLQAVGLGGYITNTFNTGDFPRMALGIAVMCLYVILCNRLIWHKLYTLAENRYT